MENNKEKKVEKPQGYIISDKEKVEFEGAEVIAVLGETEKEYQCRMSDGTIKFVPKQLFY